MRRMHRLGYLACATTVGYLLVTAEPLAVATHLPGGAGTSSLSDVPEPSLPFDISGDTTRPISPGSAATIDLTFSNPYNFALTVSDVTVSLRSVTAPNSDAAHPCTLADFTLLRSTMDDAMTVPAYSETPLDALDIPSDSWPTIAMVYTDENQDGCKGATVALTYAATGKHLQ